MSCQNSRTNSFCAGGRHRYTTSNVRGDSFSRGSKVINRFCSICNSENFMTDSDNTTTAEGLGDCLKSVCTKWLNASKKMARIVLKNPRRALEVGANVGTAFAPVSPTAALSSFCRGDKFYQTGEGFKLGKFA